MPKVREVPEQYFQDEEMNFCEESWYIFNTYSIKQLVTSFLLL